jgi:FMN-dependent NADH-azoreductase
MKILQINSSARSAGANSTRVADAITARLKAVATRPPNVVLRDLAYRPAPRSSTKPRSARCSRLPTSARPEQAARVALDDALIAEVQAADAIVLGVPMYNFGVPVQLKTWIDAIAKCRRDLPLHQRTAPKGLIKGKNGLRRPWRAADVYRDTPADSQVPYLQGRCLVSWA